MKGQQAEGYVAATSIGGSQSLLDQSSFSSQGSVSPGLTSQDTARQQWLLS